jgi:tetratricopeptide (TPR) repeat protein
MKEFRIILEAEKLKRKGEYDKALDKLYKIIQYNPDFIDVKFLMANIYKDKKEYGNAVKFYESLFEIMSDDILTLTNAGVMYNRMGNMDKYYELTKRAYDIDDRDIITLNNMADYYCRTNNFEQARVFIEKAIMIDKYEGVLYSTACEIALRHGETEEFYKNFELALKYSHDMSYIYQDPVFVDIIKEKCLRVILEKYGMSSKN